MKSTLIFAAAASAAVIKRQAASDCCFGINISGAQAGFTGSAGSLGELYDGQIRVGPGYSNSTFCYNQASQSIVDQAGRGCVEIGAPKQYQCDEGKTASGGITIDAAGVISHNGSSIWYECLVNDQGVYNIYTADTGLATKCQQIKLTTTNGSCGPKVSTVTAPGTTVVGPTVTMPGQTISTTVTAPAQVSTVTGPAQVSTVTAPAPAPQVSTVTIPGAGSVTTVTAQATCPAPVAASTITVTGPAPAAQTVTVSAPAPAAQTVTVSAPAPAAQTVTVTAPAPAAQTVTVTSVQSCATQTQTKVQATTATQVQATTVVVPTTVVSVSMAVSTQTQVVPTTLTQSGTTVVVSQTTKQTVSVPVTVTQSTTAVVTPSTTSSAAPTTSSSAAPTPSNVCPLTLADKTYTYPHLIVPVNSAQPNKAYGTQYFASVNSANSTIFNFDVEGSWAGKTCDVVFTIPEKALLETTDYTLKSGGSFAVAQLNTVATQQTTYSNMGAGKALGNFPVVVGTKNVIVSGPCAAGTAQSFEFTAASGLDLTWFNDWNPCPLGVFMVAH